MDNEHHESSYVVVLRRLWWGWASAIELASYRSHVQ